MKAATRLGLMIILVTFISSFSSIYAQDGKTQSVIVSVYIEGVYHNQYTIETVKPDYTVENKSYTTKDNLNVILKKELDTWLEQGFQLKESNSILSSGGHPIITYVLIKE